jgi:glutamate dehydrogenase/leucine dehydrogenase
MMLRQPRGDFVGEILNCSQRNRLDEIRVGRPLGYPTKDFPTCEIFSHPDYDAHEALLFAQDTASGLRALIAIHDTTLGPAFGGAAACIRTPANSTR